MNSILANTTTVGAGAGSMGAGGMVVVVLVWLCSLKGITLPPDVAIAIAGLLSMVVHQIVAAMKPAAVIPAVPAALTPLTPPKEP